MKMVIFLRAFDGLRKIIIDAMNLYLNLARLLYVLFHELEYIPRVSLGRYHNFVPRVKLYGAISWPEWSATRPRFSFASDCECSSAPREVVV